MTGRLFLATTIVLASISRAAAQTAPLPAVPGDEQTGFLTRSAFFISIARMQSDDPRFSWIQRSRADLDLFRYSAGRLNFLIDTELVMGRERREFDLNHANVIFEMSSSYRLGPIDVAGVVHHVSRHVVDREFDRVPAWHTVGGRANRLFARPRSTLDVSVEYDRVVQRTYVDYTWTSQLTIRFDRTLAPNAHLLATGSGGFVGTDPAVLNRDRQAGARLESGLHLLAPRAAADFYAAYERRVDGYPTARRPSSWFEAGFRLESR